MTRSPAASPGRCAQAQHHGPAAAAGGSARGVPRPLVCPPCRLCGGNSDLLFEARGYPIVRCGSCGIAFTWYIGEEETAADFYQEQYFAGAEKYAQSLESAAEIPPVDLREQVRAVCDLLGQQSGRILDIGCAAGALLRVFREAGWQCHGIEPSSRLAARARALAGCTVEERLFEHVSLRPESFDVISALHVLEHSADPRLFLMSCRRIVRRGGLLVLEVPDFGSRAARRQGENWHALCPDTHRFHFSRATLSALLKESGFEVVRWRRYGGLGLSAPSRSGEGAADSAGGSSLLQRAVQAFFRGRSVVWRIPGAKRLARFVWWQVLGMNEYLRLHAVAGPAGNGKVSPSLHVR